MTTEQLHEQCKGLNGLGVIRLGETVDQVKRAIQRQNSKWENKGQLRLSSMPGFNSVKFGSKWDDQLFYDMHKSVRLSTYNASVDTLRLTEEESVIVRLVFHRDTLMTIHVCNRDQNKIKQALIDKYGDGVGYMIDARGDGNYADGDRILVDELRVWESDSVNVRYYHYFNSIYNSKRQFGERNYDLKEELIFSNRNINVWSIEEERRLEGEKRTIESEKRQIEERVKRQEFLDVI